MKTRYFDTKEKYFKFIDKNKGKQIKYFICKWTNHDKIKVVYEFI